MADPTFRAKVRPALSNRAQELVAVYESTPGSTGPGACPEAIAAVLRYIAHNHAVDYHDLEADAMHLEGGV